jgi:hypothetical protein
LRPLPHLGRDVLTDEEELLPLGVRELFTGVLLLVHQLHEGSGGLRGELVVGPCRT